MLTVHFQVGPDFGGATVALTDRLFAPCDDAATKQAHFAFHLDANNIAPGKRHSLRLSWDISTAECLAKLDDGEPVKLALTAVGETFGISYLTLRSTAASTDSTGLLIDRVSVDVEP